jgi:FkbM family methyltransferase
MRVLLASYRTVFARRRFHRWNRLLFDLSLRGLGVLNYENGRASGEDWLLRRIAEVFPDPTVLDVGGNVGSYSIAIMQAAPKASVYAFEPHPVTFGRLQAAAERWGFVAINAGCGEQQGVLVLHDYADDPSGSAHATLYREVIEEIHRGASAGREVAITTVDRFLREQDIGAVNLLKIDTEGHEYQVLLGAQHALAAGNFDVIHFEFNEMNVFSRRFLRDFRELLQGFELHRLLPTDLLPLEARGAPLFQELFGYQNIIAVRARAAAQLRSG